MELSDGRRFLLLNEARQEAYITAWNVLMKHGNLFPFFESSETTNSVLLAILDDNPGMFWFEGAWQIVPYGRLHCHPFYTCSKDEASHRTRELEGVLRGLQARIGATDPYHIALWLYDWMFENVYRSPVVKQDRELLRIRTLINGLYGYYHERPQELPEEQLRLLEKDGIDEVVKDYIAGMTDRYAVKLYTELFVPALYFCSRKEAK